VTSKLCIERLVSTYLVPRDHPSPQELRAEMDDLARKYVTESCRRAFAAVLDPNDPSVWVISDVGLELLIDVHAAPADDIAAFWASKIAASVARVVAGGEDGARVLRFANRAAFLAHLLRNLADGSAWTKWYFAEFDSLRSLPTGAAIREVLLREPSRAEAALMELAATNKLSQVCRVLSARDQELIIGCCAGEATPSAVALKTVLQWMKTMTWNEFLPLDVYVRARLELVDLPPLQVANAVACASHIGRWALENKLPAMVASLQADRFPASQAAPEEVGTLALLLDIGKQDRAWLGTLADAGPWKRPAGEGVYEFDSALGAVFLLLPALVNSAELLELFGGPQNATPRYLLFLTCFARKWQDAWRDSALRVASGLNDVPAAAVLEKIPVGGIPPSLEALALAEDVAFFHSYGGELLPGFVGDRDLRKRLAVAAAVLVRAFARGLPALGGSSIEYLWQNVLSGDARIAVERHAIAVRLKPRPLQIVLRMAGLQVLRFEIPWLGDTRITVRFDED
jgi:hypothetical protein